MTSIGTEHPTAENIPHTSPLNHIITRSDSGAGASPPSHSPSLSSPSTNPLSAVGAGDGAGPTINGPSPAGMHRGSINGIPGGNNMQPTGSISIVNSRSPQKESYLSRSASINDPENGDEELQEARDNVNEEIGTQSMSPPSRTGAIPIRR